MAAFLLRSRARLVTRRAVSILLEVMTTRWARSTPASRSVLSCLASSTTTGSPARTRSSTAAIFVDQHVSASALPEVRDEARAQLAVADDNHVIFHFAGKHAASFLRIVALQRLKNENGNDDPEQNALAPERIECPERPWPHAKVDGVQKCIAKRKLLEMVEDNGSKGEPEREQRKTPSALTEKDREPYPKEAAHGQLPLLHREHGTRS